MVWVGVAAAVIGGASAIHQGEQSRAAGTKSARAQKAAQRQSLLSSINQEKLAGQAERKANKRKPDVTSILFQERAGATQGTGSTILAGRSGAPGLLGSKSTLMG